MGEFPPQVPKFKQVLKLILLQLKGVKTEPIKVASSKIKIAEIETCEDQTIMQLTPMLVIHTQYPKHLVTGRCDKNNTLEFWAAVVTRIHYLWLQEWNQHL